MNINTHIKEVNRIYRWERLKRNLKHGGSNGRVGKGFQIVAPQCVSIGDNFSAGLKLKVQAWKLIGGEIIPEIEIGRDVHFIDNCQISCANRVFIGDGCLFGDNVFITDNYHGSNSIDELDIPPHKRKIVSKGPVEIGNNVWIGRNVCIMPGVSIGDGAVIGANAVVTHDIPAGCIAAGVPARVIKHIV